MFGRKSSAKTITREGAPAPQPRLEIAVRYISRQYTSTCPHGAECSLSPGRGLPWVAQRGQRQASVEAVYAHLYSVHDMTVPEIEALPVKDR